MVEIKTIKVADCIGTMHEEKWVNMTTEEIKAEPVLCSGWASKGKVSNPHFGVSKSLQLAIAEKCPNLVKYKIEGSKGTQVAVLDPTLLVEDILNTYIDAKGLVVQKIAVSRATMSTEQREVMSAMQNPDIMAEIKAIMERTKAK